MPWVFRGSIPALCIPRYLGMGGPQAWHKEASGLHHRFRDTVAQGPAADWLITQSWLSSVRQATERPFVECQTCKVGSPRTDGPNSHHAGLRLSTYRNLELSDTFIRRPAQVRR